MYLLMNEMKISSEFNGILVKLKNCIMVKVRLYVENHAFLSMF